MKRDPLEVVKRLSQEMQALASVMAAVRTTTSIERAVLDTSLKQLTNAYLELSALADQLKETV